MVDSSWEDSSSPSRASCGSSSKKWVCKSCTYENWPRAVRCAICCHPKNYSPFLDPQKPQDIYEIASLVESDKSTALLYNPKNKWSCSSCTYLNWPKASKCTQCQRRRSSSPHSSDSFGPTGVKSSLKDRHLIAQRDSDQLIHHPSHGSHHRRGNERNYSMTNPWSNSSPSPPSSVHDRSISVNNTSSEDHSLSHHYNPSDSFYNDRNHLQQQTGQPNQQMKTRPSDQVFMNFKSSVKPAPPVTSSRDLVASNFAVQSSLPSSPVSSTVLKWSCPTCTYENWPRAVKCSMCYAVKPNHSSSSLEAHSLLLVNESLDKLSLEDSQEVAEASGGFVIEANNRNMELASDEPQSGFSSDSETEEVDPSFESRKKSCNTSKK